MSSTLPIPFRPFGALKLLGIDPNELKSKLEFQKEPRESSILQRTMVVIKQKNEQGEEVEVRQKLIEYLNDVAGKKFIKPGGIDLRSASVIAIAALYDCADMFSFAKKGSPEKEFNKFCMKPMKAFNVEKTEEYSAREGRIVEKTKIKTGADEYRKKYHDVLRGLNSFDFIDSWQYLPKAVRRELPEKLKWFNTQELTLTELTIILNALKDKTGAIGKEGVELIEAQMNKFATKVMAAFSMPDSAAREKEINQLREDFTAAFKMNEEGDFAKDGLMRHLEKAKSKIEKYLKKIGRVLMRKDKAYQIAKTQRKAGLAAFSELGEMLYGEQDPAAKEMAKNMEEGFALVAKEEAELVQTIEAAEAAASVQESSAEQAESLAEIQAADPIQPEPNKDSPQIKEEASAVKPGAAPVQTDVQQAQVVKPESVKPPLPKGPRPEVGMPQQTKDKPTSQVGGLIWKFEHLKHKDHEKSVSPPIETGVKVSELRKKFEPPKPDEHPSSKRPGK